MSSPSNEVEHEIEIEPISNHTSTLIFLHGLGDSGHGWSSALERIQPPNMKIVCPNAPSQPVALNGGFRMPSWFDLKRLDMSGTEDEKSLKVAAKTIHALICKENEKGIPTTRIVLGGFSQGGALALYSGLTYAKPLAGIVALSSWLPLHQKFPAAKLNNNNIPIFQAHGDIDSVVHYKYGQESANVLQSFMQKVTFKTYHGLSHSGSDAEMNDLRYILAKWVLSRAPFIVEPLANHLSTFIFMHGLGDNGQCWSEVIGRIQPWGMKIVCPNAPKQRVTINGGFRMPSWFDFKRLDMSGTEDEKSLKAAAKTIHAMINKEIKDGIPSARIVLGGFSQGGALALYSGLTYTRPLAGIVILSSWLPLHQQFPEAKLNSDNIPIFQIHGDLDPIVCYEFAQQSACILLSFMKNVIFKSYCGLSHTGSDAIMDTIKHVITEWIQ
uniref:palmitoyl-protein hydrolase n=1 Tax=Glossina pallidipes TaxID=7398 RepID=A0A1B0A8C2_GLOPL